MQVDNPKITFNHVGISDTKIQMLYKLFNKERNKKTSTSLQKLKNKIAKKRRAWNLCKSKAKEFFRETLDDLANNLVNC